MRREWTPDFYTLGNGVVAYISQGGFCMNNPGFVAGENCMMGIDTMAGIALTSMALEGAKERLNKPVQYLLYTHGHGDHVHGSAVYGDAIRIGTQQVWDSLAEKAVFVSDAYKAMNPVEMTGIRYLPPEMIVEDSLELDLGDQPVAIYHMGHCHTQSDTIAFVPKAKTVFCGDIFYNFELPDGNVGCFENWIAALEKIAALDAEHFVPGHGPVADRKEFEAYIKLMKMMYRKAVEAKTQGIHQRECAREMDLEEFEDWSLPHRLFSVVDTIYRGLEGKNTEPSDWDIRSEINRVKASRQRRAQ